MKDNETQFQQIMDGLPLDDQPDPLYRRTLRETILIRFDAMQSPRESTQSAKRLYFEPRKIVQLAAAAVVVLTVGALILYMTVGQGPGIAFADVQRQILEAKTLSCILTVVGKATASVAPGKEITKTLIVDKNGNVIKEEVEEKTIEGQKAKLQDVNFTMKITTKEPGLSRVDILSYNDNKYTAAGTYTITDTQKGKTAFFQTKQKLYVLEDTPKNGPLSTGFESVFRQCMDRVKTADAKPLGEKTIDGRKAKGYAFKGGEVWADAKTAKPILIIINQKDPQGNPNKIEISNIRINEPLKDSLFSMNVPKGYIDLNNMTVEELKKIQSGENKAVFVLPSVTTEEP